MKLVNGIICLICLLPSACRNMNINIKYSSPIHNYNYELPYDGGYYFSGDNRTKILLKFNRPNAPFKKDTDERLYIYIVYNGQDIRSFNPEQAKAFFIRVQAEPYFGYMKFEEIKFEEANDKIVISGKLATGQTYPDTFGDTKLEVSFNNLLLSNIESFRELQKQSNEYYKDKLKELFFSEWY
jgi:hypothetical protein